MPGNYACRKVGCELERDHRDACRLPFPDGKFDPHMQALWIKTGLSPNPIGDGRGGNYALPDYAAAASTASGIQDSSHYYLESSENAIGGLVPEIGFLGSLAIALAMRKEKRLSVVIPRSFDVSAHPEVERIIERGGDPWGGTTPSQGEVTFYLFPSMNLLKNISTNHQHKSVFAAVSPGVLDKMARSSFNHLENEFLKCMNKIKSNAISDSFHSRYF